MKIKMILPALTEAKSPYFRPIKYSLFPPLGLATLAAYANDCDEVTLHDEHVETLALDDEPDLVVIQVYITSALRSYQIADHYRARGLFVALGGLHVTSCPEEAARHADAVFLGPGEEKHHGRYDQRPQRDFATAIPGFHFASMTRILPPSPRALSVRSYIDSANIGGTTNSPRLHGLIW
jgi:hypothetical protein